MMTLHASKELEFPQVFLIGIEKGILPQQTSIDEDNVEEECLHQYSEMINPQISRFYSS